MEIGIDMKDVYIPSEDLVAREIEGELIIVPVSLNVINFEDAIYTLNSTGKEIWARLGKGVQIYSIIQELVQEYDAPPQKITKDVKGLLKELLRKKIIVKCQN